MNASALPVGWRIGRLSDLCTEDREILSAGNGGDLPYVGLDDVESQSGAIIRYLGADDADVPSGTAFRFSPHHILYGKLRPYLNKVALPDRDGRCSTELIPLRLKGDTSREFAAYALRRPDVVKAVMARNKGARMPRADIDFLFSLPIVIPPLAEQRRIVDILSCAEGIVRLQRQAAEKAGEITPALFLDMFGNSATNPKEWPTVSLGELIMEGPQNGLYKPLSAYGEGVPILRIDGFYDGRIVNLGSLRRLKLTQDETHRFSLRQGDIVINRVNSPEYLGKSAIVPPLNEPTVFESNMMKFSVDRGRIHPGFVIQLLQTNFLRQSLLRRAKHAINQSSINQQDVKALQIILPPINLQQEFVLRSESLAVIATSRQSALRSSEELFQSLFHRAFPSAP